MGCKNCCMWKGFILLVVKCFINYGFEELLFRVIKPGGRYND